MKIVVLETEPEGTWIEHPDIYVFESDEMTFNEAEMALLRIATFHPFVANYHRGPHMGAVAMFIDSKYHQFMKVVRQNTKEKQPDGIDHLQQETCKNADFVIETLLFDRYEQQDSLLYDELEEYLKHVQDVIDGDTYLSKRRKLELKNATTEQSQLIKLWTEKKWTIKDFLPEEDDGEEEENTI